MKMKQILELNQQKMKTYLSQELIHIVVVKQNRNIKTKMGTKNT